MAVRPKIKKRARSKPLYFASKISDYQFRRVLWHFARDDSAQEAARHVRLSETSIGAIYTKLRAFLFDIGLFLDIYKGRDPRDGLGDPDAELYEFNLIDFHLERVARKHGALDSAMDAPDYHFAESCWRQRYRDIVRERDADAAQRAMFADLLEFVRRFGPVGGKNKPTAVKRLAGLRLALAQQDRLLLWIERNASRYRDPAHRALIRQMREE